MKSLPTVLSPTELSNSFLGNLIQICFVTRDHRRTIEGLAGLGIGPWTIRTFDSSNLSQVTYRGKPAEWACKLCLANSQNMNWEVIEPLSGPSIYNDYLEKHGEGIQHLAFNCNGQEYEERLRQLLARGYEVVQSGVILDQLPFHYFASKDLATIVEVYQVPAGFAFPPPEAWYPAPPPHPS